MNRDSTVPKLKDILNEVGMPSIKEKKRYRPSLSGDNLKYNIKKGITGINLNTTLHDSQTSFIGLGLDKSSINDDGPHDVTPRSVNPSKIKKKKRKGHQRKMTS